MIGRFWSVSSGARRLVLASLVMVSTVRCGAQLEGKAKGVSVLIKQAWKNGAYKCAPRELTLAEANLRFARDHISQGNYHNAQAHLVRSERYAREAIRKSPPERCAAPKVVEAPPPRRPVKVVVKVVDTDKDGIPDVKDKCPTDPEDKDGFEDADGCPDPDNDGDTICDDNPNVQGRLAHFAAKCHGRDQCSGTEADKANGFAKTQEDMDGFQDADGCPDPDNDGDKICDGNAAIQQHLTLWQSTCKGSDQCAGKDADKTNGFAKTKEDMDGFQDTDGCPDPDNDGDKICDGNADVQSHVALWQSVCKGKDQCPGVDADKTNNFVKTREIFNHYQDTDGCPDKLQLVVVTAKRIEIKQKIYFDFNKARIKPVSFEVLNQVAQVLVDHSTMRVRIEGHTDSRGSSRYNRRLSRRRARSVRRYLIGKGVDPGRLTAVGYGEDRPIDTNRTAAGRERNRRVEFHITHH
ncbi:MAG: OmpA family protein [Deltaproteobacteria bacterium]|nr:OmpA family protein [Deltaproteobacteria bacterium]